MNSRLKSIYSQLKQRGLDGLLVSLPANVSYLTESLSRDAYLLVSAKENIYFTDSRYTEEAKAFLKDNALLKECNGGVFKHIAETALDLGLKTIGFEERYLPFAEFTKVKEYSRGKFGLVPTHSIIEDKRQVKDAQEIAKLKQAARITVMALDHIKKFLAPGVKEIEIVAELERFMRYHGSQGPAFDIIVAAGANSSQPHHLSGTRKLKDNEPVLIDLGVNYQGYKSDLTRVLFLGKINILVRKVYDIVLRAQELAIKMIRPGAEMAEIDRVAREYIASQGYGACFTHNLGHGFGLEIHEAPHISGREASALKPGMTFTVEPGIYLPGKFGIRIEDMVLITTKSCEVISGARHK
ncbi:MAG TPA: aminopeptidase P family protein [Candidatus Omnitrophota bacterium]|nr:aminopeptidase P family protein [Candidatus Omnitrophota bacterium]HPT39321.1 aminopeptidase P family protein [Candidatus Omnitrophota bacterium]